MFHRKKNKPLELSLNDSNYLPAPDPNSLIPQAATGHSRASHAHRNAPLPATPPKRLRQQIHDMPRQTVINNYYYTPNSEAPVRSRYQDSQPMAPSHSQRHRSNHYTSAQNVIIPDESDMIMRGDDQSIHHHHHHRSGSHSHSSSRSPSDDIYSSSSLVSGRRRRTDYDNDDYDTRSSDYDSGRSYRSRGSFDLLRYLVNGDSSDITVHNTRLLTIFQSFDKEFIDCQDLAELLVDPMENHHFTLDSCNSIIQAFDTKTMPGKLDFRGFVHVCAFVKGCCDSFEYYDKDHSYTLEYQEFVKALNLNGMKCPSGLMTKIFRNSDYVSIERFITAVVAIRRYERAD